MSGLGGWLGKEDVRAVEALGLSRAINCGQQRREPRRRQGGQKTVSLSARPTAAHLCVSCLGREEQKLGKRPQQTGT